MTLVSTAVIVNAVFAGLAGGLGCCRPCLREGFRANRTLPRLGSRRVRLSVSHATKRATVYFDAEIHRALRLKAAETDRSVSELVNDAVKASLAEDAEDLTAFELREPEPDPPFESVVKDLKRRGKV